jgi:hypothetical protein
MPATQLQSHARPIYPIDDDGLPDCSPSDETVPGGSGPTPRLADYPEFRAFLRVQQLDHYGRSDCQITSMHDRSGVFAQAAWTDRNGQRHVVITGLARSNKSAAKRLLEMLAEEVS